MAIGVRAESCQEVRGVEGRADTDGEVYEYQTYKMHKAYRVYAHTCNADVCGVCMLSHRPHEEYQKRILGFKKAKEKRE